MVNSRKLGRQQGDSVIPLRIVPVIAAALLLTTCQVDYVESLPIPPNLPVAAIDSKKGAVTDSEGNPIVSYMFSLTWKREAAILSQAKVYDLNDPYVQDIIKETYVKWGQFEQNIDPRPYGELNMSTLQYDVFLNGGGGGRWVLNNEAQMKLFVRRCWPRSLMEQETPPTRDEWFASFDERVAEFKQAVKDIKAMMATLERSPLFNLEIDGEPLLAQLHKQMEELIVFPSNPETHEYEDRGRWGDADLIAEGANRKFIYDPNRTGPLYEYYFGYAPMRTDYYKSAGQFAFPVND